MKKTMVFNWLLEVSEFIPSYTAYIFLQINTPALKFLNYYEDLVILPG